MLHGIELDVIALFLTVAYLVRLLYVSFREQALSQVPNTYQRGLKISLVHQRLPTRRTWLPGVVTVR